MKWQPAPMFLPGKSHGQESEGLQSIGSKRVRHDLATQLQEENVPLLNTSDVSSHNNSY